jgi:hypothetical protein
VHSNGKLVDYKAADVQATSVYAKELKDCGEPAISLHSHHVSLVQWTTCLLPITRDSDSNPLGGYLCETGILLLALSRYIGDPDLIDHHGLV